MKKSALFIFFTFLTILAIFSRFAFLEARVLHHDESVNYYFADKILEEKTFNYDYTNYHGPLYFFAIALSFIIFNISEFSLRLPAVLFSLLTIALSIFIASKNKKFLLAPLFIIISPSILYYSRYSIHESAFIFFTLLALYSLSLIIEKKSLKYLPLFASSLALLFVTKETAIIVLFISLAIILFNFKTIKEIKIKNNYKIILFSISLFIIIYIIFFTSFFTNSSGVNDSFKAFSPWVDRGLNEQGHDKPFIYYATLLLKYEFPLLILALLSLYLAFKGKNTFLRSFAIWFILIFIIYSLIPYKTPWLIINFTLPLAFLASNTIHALYSKNKALSFIILLAAVIYLSYISIQTSFINISSPTNDFAYVHTNPEIMRIVEIINQNYKETDKILVVSQKYWPLPFYFHGKDIYYLDNEEIKGYPSSSDYKFLILRERVFNSIPQSDLYTYNKYNLLDGENLVLAIKK